jgi:hypothetical protein
MRFAKGWAQYDTLRRTQVVFRGVGLAQYAGERVYYAPRAETTH